MAGKSYNTRNYVEVAENAKYTFMQNGSLSVEGAAIKFAYFDPNESKFHNRGFNLVLSEEIAHELERLNWDVKYSEPNGDWDGYFFVSCAIKIDGKYPPRIELITSYNGRQSRQKLLGDDINELQNHRYSNIDLIVRPNANTMKPYLNVLIAVEDESFGAGYFGGKYDGIRYIGDPIDDDMAEELPFN